MSSKFFKPSNAREVVERGSRYKPGEAPAYEALADRLVTEYLERGIGAIRWKSDGGKVVEGFSSQIRTVECGDGQDFLDVVVERLGFYASTDHQKHADSFISPLVNLLYERGQDSFTLDLTSWARAPEFLAEGIVGTGERPVSLHYKMAPLIKTDTGFDVVHVGWDSEHIVLRLRGTAVCSAHNCKHSEFIFERSVMNIAEGSTANCVFRLEDVVRIRSPRDSDYLGYNIGVFREGVRPEKAYIDRRFYINNNTLLVPDNNSDSGWREVTLE